MYTLPFPQIYPLIRSLLTEQEHFYLVGGVVRDILLSRAPQDIDLVLQASAAQVKAVARRLANHFDGNLFSLDDERCTFRIFVADEWGTEWKIDIAMMRGESLKEDLLLRDFTINAMAFAVGETGEYRLIDPSGGNSDLVHQRLVPVTPHAISDDSIRILRGVRMAHTFNLRMDTDLIQKMKEAVPNLRDISGERFRDEFFRLLSAPFATDGLVQLNKIGVLNSVLDSSQLILTQEQLFPLNNLDQLSMEAIMVSPFMETVGQIAAGLEEALTSYLIGSISADRSRLSLLKLVCLLMDLMKPELCISYFAFSQREKEYITTILSKRQLLLDMIEKNHVWTRKDVYRFFKVTSESGVGICLLLLAQTTPGDEIGKKLVTVCRLLLQSYFQQYGSIVKPEPLINGNQVMTLLQISPGPRVGYLLELLMEAQAAGDVLDVDDAIRFILNNSTDSCNGTGDHPGA